MTRKIALTARQVTAICKGAEKAGFVAEVRIGEVVIRLVPSDQLKPLQGQYDPDNPETFETLEQYRAWRDRKASDFEWPAPVIASRHTALADHYRKAGIDPARLSADEQRRSQVKADAAWEEQLLKSALNSNEQRVLGFLAERSGARYTPSSVKGAGPDTTERLILRGFVEVSFQTKFPDRIKEIWATPNGVTAWTDLQRRNTGNL